MTTAGLRTPSGYENEGFGRLVAVAALRECGSLAINHARVAGCQYGGAATSRCAVVGMDAAGGFDSAGLSRAATLTALRGVGIETTELAERNLQWRHVGQLAALAEKDFLPDDLSPGTHLLFERKYVVRGQRTVVPGHMGIIVSRRTDGDFDLVQTVQSRRKVTRSIWRPERPGPMCQPWGIIPAHRLAQALLEASSII